MNKNPKKLQIKKIIIWKNAIFMKIAFITKQILNITNTNFLALWYAKFVIEKEKSPLTPIKNLSYYHSLVDLYVILIVAMIKRAKIKISNNVRIIPTFSPLRFHNGFAKLK